jgi:sec-independent protein translocase protein TatC
MDSEKKHPEVSEDTPEQEPAGADVPPQEPVSPESGETHVSHEPTNEATDSYSYYDDYGYEQYPDSNQALAPAPEPAAAATPPAASPPPPSAPASSSDDEEEDDPEEQGMLRMSFLEHLEELRLRIVRALMGVGVAFVACIYFTNDLWQVVQAPAQRALAEAGFQNPKLVVTSATEAFSIIWVKLPILCAIFLSSPWLLYQVWSFIAPGLYKTERRWAAPFVICSAGLFILGGLFAYLVAFRFGLTFLLGIAYGQDLQALISITEYFDLFVNVSLGMGIVFELPILIFFLALLRLVTPQFLMRNSRYAILLIIVVAAIVTPTPDVINLMLVSVPMTLLYFGGVFAAYLLWLSREGRRFPWQFVVLILAGILLLFGGGVYLAMVKYGYRLVHTWPFLVR